eukprot:3074032-Prymnesium_polylepis.1
MLRLVLRVGLSTNRTTADRHTLASRWEAMRARSSLRARAHHPAPSSPGLASAAPARNADGASARCASRCGDLRAPPDFASYATAYYGVYRRGE